MSEPIELSKERVEKDKPLNTFPAEALRSITLNKQRFALIYSQTGHAGRAGEAVGVSATTGQKWARDLKVLALTNFYIQEHAKEVAQDHLISRLMMERMQLDIYDKASGAVETEGVDKEGVATSHKIVNLTAANQALANLNKMRTDAETLKVGATGTAQVILNIEQANFNSNQHLDLFRKSNEVIEHE